MFAAKDCLPYETAASRRPGTFAAPARIINNIRQNSQNRPCVFSRLRTLLSAQKFQSPYFHSLPHSLQQERNLTPAFPIASALFLRSCAQERKSTPLFSCACARFCRYVGVWSKIASVERIAAALHSILPADAPRRGAPVYGRQAANRETDFSSTATLGCVHSVGRTQSAALKSAALHSILRPAADGRQPLFETTNQRGYTWAAQRKVVTGRGVNRRKMAMTVSDVGFLRALLAICVVAGGDAGRSWA